MSKKHKKHHKSDKTALEDKPGLKLVLKVGLPEQVEGINPPEVCDEERKHRHKHKKKKKHKHHHEKKDRERKRPREPGEPGVPTDDEAPPAKRKAEEIPTAPIAMVTTPKAAIPLRAVSDGDLATSRARRERHNPDDEWSALQRCLDFFQRTLQKKDLNGIFAFPVTDAIAPGYSNIIQNPMDFSTMKRKIENNEYETILEYKKDFKLMLDNCMMYNHPETIYSKEAQKLLASGMKQMSKERIILLKKNLPLVATMTDHELGLDQEGPLGGAGGSGDPALPRVFTPKLKKKPTLSKFEAFPDRLTPEQILRQAQEAAKEAAEMLTLRQPRSKFGFLRRRNDGSTTFNILNPDNRGIVSEKERVVNLGELNGKLASGTGGIAGFKEDKRNRANPVNYLNYGPFSSYAPVFDSSAANISKDDSDLLLTTFGDDTGVQYAMSLRHFVKGAGDYAIRMVDNLLDILTGGEHSKAISVIQQHEKEEEEKIRKDEEAEEEKARQAAAAAAAAIVKPEIKVEEVTEDKDSSVADQSGSGEAIDFKSLQSLEDLGLDVSFLDSLEKSLDQSGEQEGDPEEDPIQKKLTESSSLIQDLEKSQTERLSQPPPAHLAELTGPGQAEGELADKVRDELKDLVKQATPGDVISPDMVRNTIGVTLTPHVEDEDVVSMETSTEEALDKSNCVTMAAADTTTNENEVVEATPPHSDLDTAQGHESQPQVQGEVALPSPELLPPAEGASEAVEEVQVSVVQASADQELV